MAASNSSGLWLRPCAILLASSLFALALVSVVSAGDPPQASQAASKPHHGSYETPRLSVERPGGPVRVETPDGPVFIKQCVVPEGDASLMSADDWVQGGYYPGCLICHQQIENAMENMGGFNFDCIWCHGGDPYAITMDRAHVHPNGQVTYDQRVPPIDEDLDYQRFVNPSNLRAVDQVCSLCHPTIVSDIKKSMMATAAGHYAGGFYQNNVIDSKTPVHGTFEVTDDDGDVPTDKGAVEHLEDLHIFDPNADPELFATHFAAVPSQACARCHLWSRGKGYRGATGQDGVYRADGCAACHMPYADDGLSHSSDPRVNHLEPGHPITHVLTKQVPTNQCLHCHHRGARIGLTFTGRSQMPPRLPSGPGVPGTTDEIFNGNYHYTDPATNPPDAHHELGMHCIDCHTSAELMGDGNIWGHMDQATKIECRTCHGTHDEAPSLADNDGGVLQNLATQPNGDIVLTSKVTGAEHPVPVVMDLVDPSSASYNPEAAACMNDDHLSAQGGLECYACHSAWVPNCFGCHFERDEQQLGLNLMTGQLEVGKATTNNKIFETMRLFSFGLNSEGRVAPYLVACHPIADVTAPDGTKILDFAMPVTTNGLSGLAHNPVQPHSVRSVGETRSCAECHRSPPSLGFGTGNYAIARERIYAAGSAGLERFERDANPDQPVPGGVTPGAAHAIAALPDVVEGTAELLYVARGTAGVEILGRRLDAVVPSPVHTITGVDAIDVSRAARYLYVVESGVGVRVYDTREPTVPKHLATIAIPGALRAVPWGIHLFVPAGPDGLFVVDIADHTAPFVAGVVPGMNAVDVEPYAHYQGGSAFAARAYVADPDYGVRILDLLPDFEDAQIVGGLPLIGASGLDAYTRYVLATATVPSREHDYLYVAAGAAGLRVFDMTDPDAVVEVAAVRTLGGWANDVVVCSQLAPPGTDDYAYVANLTSGLQVVEVTDPTSPLSLGSVPGSSPAERLSVEVQQMDRFLDEQGEQLKENSHPFVETFTREDIVRIMKASIP